VAANAPFTESPLPLRQAIAHYLSTLPQEDRESASRELARFSRFIGNDIPVQRIRAADVGRYQESLPESSVDINQRLEPLKIFLTHLKMKMKVTEINLGAHVRLKRTAGKRNGAGSGPEVQAVRMTAEGYAALSEELDHLEREVRPEVTQEMARAAADKDFRENAPYDAAKQRLSEVQGRINELRAMLSSADVLTGDSGEQVDLGVTVVLHDLQDADTVTYTVVGPGEVNLREGKISGQSPVGSALMNKRIGDVVEVNTPAGSKTYRIEQIERRKAVAAL
jgi:transcription elongation factor GreA